MLPGFSLKREALIWLIILAPLIYMFIIWDQLPAQIPTHWNLRGEVDNYGSPLVLPGINALLYIVFLVLPLFDPRKRNYDFFASSYYKIRLFIAIFLSGMAIISILVGLGHAIDVPRVVLVAVMGLLAILGNYMKTVQPNWFVGFRTPWTLENETVWRKTHRLGGRLWFAGGLLGLVLAMLLPSTWLAPLMLILIGILVLVPTVYSYRLYQQVKAT